jgi:GWxTD domain-containing protein
MLDAEPQQFWEERDPLFLTDENERLSEHISRMAYANLRFKVSKIDIEGWETDRGKAFIRYGHPLFIISIGKDIGLAPIEKWFYPGFKLSFEDNFWNGNYRFASPELSSAGVSAFKSRADADYVMVANDIFKELPEIYDFSLAGGKFESAYKFAAFKGADNQTEMMLTFELPIDGFEKLDSLNFETGIFIKEKGSKTRQSFIKGMVPDYKIHGYQLVGNKLLDNIVFQVGANRYNYSFEIIERQNNAMYVSRDSISIPNFSGDNLSISDVIMANLIESEARNPEFMRNHLFILPNISQVFNAGETMYIYFEVYNLTPDETGTTMTGTSKGGFISKLFGKSQDKVTIVNEYRGSQQSDYIVQALDLSNLMNGEYQLEIKLTDNLSKATVSKSEEVQIINHN